MSKSIIGFIGSGRAAAFMIDGLTRTGKDLDFTVMDANLAVSAELARSRPFVKDAGSDYAAVGKADILFVVLHPQNMQAGCEAVAPVLSKNTIVISLAPKASIASLSTWLGTKKIVRYLPNAATGEGKGYNPVAYGEELSDPERESVGALLSTLGDMPEVEEKNIETYAVLSAMGPTYLWPILDELIQRGVAYGLDANESARLVSRMAVACAEMIEHSGKDYATRMNMIPSKPMADIEQDLRGMFRGKLDAIHAKLTS